MQTTLELLKELEDKLVLDNPGFPAHETILSFHRQLIADLSDKLYLLEKRIQEHE